METKENLNIKDSESVFQLSDEIQSLIIDTLEDITQEKLQDYIIKAVNNDYKAQVALNDIISMTHSEIANQRHDEYVTVLEKITKENETEIKNKITQEKLAASLSCSPSALANRLRLLKLPGGVLEIIRKRGLTERHARALLRLQDAQTQMEFAAQAAEGHMSVKQLETQIDRAVHRSEKAARRRASPIIRDNRIVINALMDTVRELGRIGVRVTSRIEEKADHVEIVVCIPACTEVDAEDK